MNNWFDSRSLHQSNRSYQEITVPELPVSRFLVGMTTSPSQGHGPATFPEYAKLSSQQCIPMLRPELGGYGKHWWASHQWHPELTQQVISVGAGALLT